MSETRDLGVPILAFLVGVAVAIWNATAGDPTLAVAAGALGLVVGGASLALGMNKRTGGAGASTAVALGGVIAAAGLAPPFAPNRHVLLALGLAVAAFAVPARPRPSRTRVVALGVAAALALGGTFLATRPGVGRAASGYLLALAVAAAWVVVRSRPVALVEVPKGPRIGVYGGTFDPFHVGHREICERALAVCDRVLVVVTARPPHKGAQKDITPFHHRVAMARLGVEGLPRIEVLELENRREGPSYTIDTLVALGKLQPPGTQFRLVIGGDSFQEFPLWKDWEGILDRATLLVAVRPGFDLEAPPEFEGRNAPVEELAVEPKDVSSTEIRRRVAAGEPVTGLVSRAIEAYLGDHALYRGGLNSAPPELSGPAGSS